MKFKHDIDDGDMVVIERIVERICKSVDEVSKSITNVADAVKNKKLELK